MKNARRYTVVGLFAMLAAVGVGCSSDPDVVPIDPPDAGRGDGGPDGNGSDGGAKPKPDAGEPECATANDCPEPANECMERTCDSGVCGESPKAAGTIVSAQTAGDCKQQQCDGAGGIVAVNDDTDLPDDGNDCTDDVCTDGVPTHPPKPASTACGADSALLCDGAGKCVGCVTATDCAGDDTECKVRACEGGVCGFTNIDAGTVVSDQTAGDCKKNVCDGDGGVTSENDDTDVSDDGNDCTLNVCSMGVPSNPPKDKGEACGLNDEMACNGAGACVVAHCTDEAQNEDESDVDCGGASCAACANGKNCNSGTDCESGLCSGGVCSAAPTCTDGTQNGDETGVDCGGSCPSCVKVTSTTPSDGATDVSESTTIAITFSEAMDTATLTAQTADGGCTGSIQVSSDDFATCIGFDSPLAYSDGDTVVTLTPSAALAAGTTYTIKVTSDAKDPTGSAFAGYTSPTGFTTEAPAGSCPTGGVVISQVYGGGGNSGATYTHDFVELYNRGTTPQDLTGWSLQYASATGNFTTNNNQRTNLSGTIPPGGYFLIQLAKGTGGTQALPTPDATGNTAMSASDGKLALVSSTAIIASCTAATVVDTVGFGTANCYEGAKAAPAASNTTAVHRKNAGCQDTDENGDDFETGAPTPRNSSTPAALCSCPAN